MNKNKNSEEERRPYKIGSPALVPAKHGNHCVLFSLWHEASLSTKTNTQLPDLSGARLSQDGCQSGPHALSISFFISSLVMSVAPKPSRTSQQLKTASQVLQSRATLVLQSLKKVNCCRFLSFSPLLRLFFVLLTSSPKLGLLYSFSF